MCVKEGGGGLKQEDGEGLCSKVCQSTRVSFLFSKRSDFFFFKSLHKFIRYLFFQKSKTTTFKAGGQRWCCSCTGALDKSEISGEEGEQEGGRRRRGCTHRRRHQPGAGRKTAGGGGAGGCRRRGDKRTSCVISSFTTNLSGRLVR